MLEGHYGRQSTNIDQHRNRTVEPVRTGRDTAIGHPILHSDPRIIDRPFYHRGIEISLRRRAGPQGFNLIYRTTTTAGRTIRPFSFLIVVSTPTSV